LVPDALFPDVAGAAQLTADDINVTALNLSGSPLTLSVLCESWHSFERVFGAQQITRLDSHPFVGAQSLAVDVPAVVEFPAVNGDSVTLVPGMPVSAGITDGSVVRGNATSVVNSSIFGLISVGADVTLPVLIQSESALVLTPTQWDIVTGDSGGLISGARYYLDVQPGKITTTPPSAPGSSITAIGRALSSTAMVLHIQPYIYQ